MVQLGAEFLALSPVPEELEPPAPDPGIELLREIRSALVALPEVVAAVAQARSEPPPPPTVYLPEPDLSAIVTAVNGLKPGATAQDIGREVAKQLNPAAASSETLMVEAMRELVDKIDFRLQGVGRAFGSSGPSNIADNADRLLGHVTVDKLPTPVAIQQQGSVDTNNTTTTLLGVSGVFTGVATNMLNVGVVKVLVYSDQPSTTGGVLIEYSPDGTNWDDSSVFTFTPGAAGPNQGQGFVSTPRGPWMRVVYTNTNHAQATFRLTTILKPWTAGGDVLSINGTINANDHGLLTLSQVVGATTGGGGGYVPVKVNPSGTLTVDASGTTVPISNTYLSNQTGTYNYASATLSATGNVTGVGRCTAIRVFASGADGSFNINGGNTITVRSGTGVDINPQGNLSAPVVNWVSGTIDVYVEGVS